MSKTFQEKFSIVQNTLKVAKTRFNKFGGYQFRNTEDIMEAVKPLLLEYNLTLTIDEEMVVLGTTEQRFYKNVIATISDGREKVSVSSFTREDESQKGLTSSQLSGAVGSYGAKMALRGLFLLDDTNDDDATNTHGKEPKQLEKPSLSAQPESPNAEKQEKEVPKPTSFKRSPKTVPTKETGGDDDY